MGYSLAGFDIEGVDLQKLKRYPFKFHCADALKFLADHGHEYDAIHASPPCQKYCQLKSMPTALDDHPDLIDPVRRLLMATGKPYVIENVPGAPLIHPVILCGTMFGLGVKGANAELRRHRLFETSWFFLNPLSCSHQRLLSVDVYGNGYPPPRTRERTKRLIDEGKIPAKRPRVCGVWGSSGGMRMRDGCQQFTNAERAEAMGIDWMTGKEMSQAIPPAYTKFIGEQLLCKLKSIEGVSA